MNPNYNALSRLNSLILLAIVYIMTGCATLQQRQLSHNRNRHQVVINGKLFTSVWMQKSAEYKALCIQAFNLATLRLKSSLEDTKASKPLAIITDIDETFLDNSRFAVHQALKGKGFEPAAWDDWVKRAAADTMPGALRFFQFAAKNNVAIFYVTNRNAAGREATLDNLRKYGFPDADEQHLKTSTGSSSKTKRRQLIEKKYQVVLFLGDNMADFDGNFDKKTSAERSVFVENMASEFGNKFIIIPNPNYGDWENAIYQYKHHLSQAQKDSTIRAAAKNYILE